ncbi:MAG TPA: tripartite tricarboxylate transporter substrate-binding protein [Xanthobacteraceae bacterium]|nr:tripartite tricarboxylate transporter substrate-binding protein [Xanthobacteraceae bacterium]
MLNIRKSLGAQAGAVVAFAAAGALAMCLGTPAQAQSGADFYKGKTVTYIVSTAPGGGYDFYGRLISQYMQKYLPGSTFVVKNVPGAGHLIGANTIYASKADGLTIGTFNTGLIYNQLIQAAGVKFDLTKMSWVGKAASEPRVIMVASQSPIKSWKDLMAQKEPVNFATSGVGSANYVEIHTLKEMLKMPVKILTGYNGNDDELAMRRGEVTGGMGSRSSFDEFVKNGYGRYIAQIGGNDKDVPQLGTMITDPDAKAFLALVESQGDIARLTAGPPGIPADRLAALQDAFRKAMADPELQDKVAKQGRPLDPKIGDDVLKLVQSALRQKPETVALLKEAMEAKAPAAEIKGTLTAYDGRKEFKLKGADGKEFAGEISGSRTTLTVDGKKADRDAVKVGMSCTLTTDQGAKEAKTLDCK